MLRDLDQVHAFVKRVEPFDAPDSVLSSYAFVHVLYQDALYRSLTPALRALNRGVAEALLERNKRPLSRSLPNWRFSTSQRGFSDCSRLVPRGGQECSSGLCQQEAVELSRRAMVDADRLPDHERLPITVKAALQTAELHLPE
jgi:hypothetical protein